MSCRKSGKHPGDATENKDFLWGSERLWITGKRSSRTHSKLPCGYLRNSIYAVRFMVTIVYNVPVWNYKFDSSPVESGDWPQAVMRQIFSLSPRWFQSCGQMEWSLKDLPIRARGTDLVPEWKWDSGLPGPEGFPLIASRLVFRSFATLWLKIKNEKTFGTRVPWYANVS